MGTASTTPQKVPPNGDETDIAPLPLDDDLEDENGVRGTVVGFKTPPPVSANDKVRGAKIAEGKENAPHTGSTVVLEWGKTAQKAARPEPAKRARSRARQTTMKLKFDAATILDRDAVSRAIRDASDIVKTRAPGAVRKMADLADDDRPFGADEERDDVGTPRSGTTATHTAARRPQRRPPTREPRSAAPRVGATRSWVTAPRGGGSEARAGCVRALWARARASAAARGFEARDAHARGSVRGSVAGDAEDVARVVDFDAGFDDDGDFGGGFHDDDAFGDAAGDAAADAFTPGAGRLSAARATSEALGSEPPTPAGAPSGHVDWSTATKRMLADVAPKLAGGKTVSVFGHDDAPRRAQQENEGPERSRAHLLPGVGFKDARVRGPRAEARVRRHRRRRGAQDGRGGVVTRTSGTSGFSFSSTSRHEGIGNSSATASASVRGVEQTTIWRLR